MMPRNPMEWLIILGIAMLVFGNKLPSLGRSLGQGIVEFKKGLSGNGGDGVADLGDEDRSAGHSTQQLESKPQSQASKSAGSARQQKLEA